MSSYLVIPTDEQTMTEGTASDKRTLVYSVYLTRTPSLQANETVTVMVSSGDTHAVTVEPAKLAFTPSDQNDAQRVTLTVVEDDDAKDEVVTVTHRTASSRGSGDHHGITKTLTVKVDDDETAGFVFSPTDVTVNENNRTETYTVELSALPTVSPVTVMVASHDTDTVTVNKASLTPLPVMAIGGHRSSTLCLTTVDAVAEGVGFEPTVP